MDTILFIFIGLMCLMLGVRVYCAEERNKIFNQRPLPVTEPADIKAYNHFCGALIIGFGVIAEITVYFMATTTGIVSMLCTLAMIVEAFVTVRIYMSYEKKLVLKNQEEKNKK